MAGKKLIDTYLKKNDAEGLQYLLRHHDEATISNNETWRRDEVDYFLEYFSILGLAQFAGFLSKHDLEELNVEIAYYLGNVAVKRYYYVNYPLLFPQILLEAVLTNNYFEEFSKAESVTKQFETFHLLNQTIDNEDVNQFLWFLDGGYNGGKDIDDLKEVLQQPSLVFEMMKQTSHSALHQSVRGFFEYLVFLERFKQFLDELNNSVLKASYWYYHEYWFKKIKVRLKSTINKWHNGLLRLTNEFKLMSQLNETAIKIKGKIIKNVEGSRNDYLKLLEEIVFTDVYKKDFESFIEEWRSNVQT